MEEPRRNDWASTIEADLNELNIELTTAQIGNMKI